MSYYAVSERRILPGRMPDFVEATRRVGEHFATTGQAQKAFTLYVAENDPETALLVGGWSSPAHFESARAALPAGLVNALRSLGQPGEPVDWHWYAAAREIIAFGERAGHVVATRLSVALEHLPAFNEWVHDTQDTAARLPGVVASRLLTASADPTQLLLLVEYRDDGAAAEASQAATRKPPPVPIQERRRFVGRIGYTWDRPAPPTGAWF